MRKPGVLFLIVAAVILLPVLGTVYADGIREAFMRLRAARPSGETREIVIELQDFRFSPGVIRLKAGERVRLRLRNVGRHVHEFMATGTVKLEEGVTEADEPDFFEGLIDFKVEVVQGGAMPMFEVGEEGDMGEMGDMGDMGGMEMGGDMDGATRVVLQPGYHVDPLTMGEAHGGMVMMQPAAEVVLEFTVPEDKVGTWILGCYQEDGLHFDSGMRGLLIVEP